MENVTVGTPVTIAPGIVRLTAPNPGVMTGPGTNSYIVGDSELVLVDPGPDIAAHIDALLAVVGTRLKWIVCTHTHLDHSPAAGAVKNATGARIPGRVAAQDGRQDVAFAPDRVLGDGDTLSAGATTLKAIHTPGHASNHLCYLLERQRMLFTGDHVMQGSTVIINPPDGDMRAYLASLERVLALDVAILAPGHGYLIGLPQREVRR